MIRHKWIIGVKNKLGALAMECDSAAAIEGARLTSAERANLQKHIRETIKYIDECLTK